MISSRSSIERRCSWIEKQILPGDALALDDLGNRPCELRDLVQLPRVRPHSHDHTDREAERSSVIIHREVAAGSD
jgi:hypothetical protein